MNQRDKSRLVKVLTLTQSDNDGEALNAIRAANFLLKKNSLTWEMLLCDGENSEYDFTVYSKHTEKPTVEEMQKNMKEAMEWFAKVFGGS